MESYCVCLCFLCNSWPFPDGTKTGIKLNVFSDNTYKVKPTHFLIQMLESGENIPKLVHDVGK